ncbi:hypothetical protein QR680_015688 [Steinernema hermaphroditum]|uniref:Uncharacterized protein n=1 Tax=Steinernema hermaphroditum TaxID=289476 RepID=A0AA39LL70_9BILA|nr:hypothetical protein QR680_015688 [Steinernema hermaphroditum]
MGAYLCLPETANYLCCSESANYLCCPQKNYRVATENPPKRSAKVPFRLSWYERHILRKHWVDTVLAQDPHIFLHTMVNSISDSPRLLDIIACKLYHPDFACISEWPKLKRMASGNCQFFTKQIVDNHLDEDLVRKDSFIHIQYAAYGFKPFFLDIWQLNMLKLAEGCEFPKAHEKQVFMKAFKTLLAFLCTVMVMEYEDSMQLIRHTEREYRKNELIASMV